MLTFSIKAQQVITLAKKYAQTKQHSFVSSEHLLLGILDLPSCSAHAFLLGYLKEKINETDLDNLYIACEKIVKHIPKSDSPRTIDEIPFSSKVKHVITVAGTVAKKISAIELDTLMILLGIIDDETNPPCQALMAMGVDIDEFRNTLLKEIDSDLANSSTALTPPKPPHMHASPKEGKDKKSSSGEEDLIEKFTVNLTVKAAYGDLPPVIGREMEIDRALQILSRKQKNNPVLIGEPGVGKTAIVEGIAQRIVSGNVPDNLYTKQVFVLDMALLVAGTIYRGQFEERLTELIKEFAKIDCIVFIDELHTIIGAGGPKGGLDASNILKPALSRGEFTCIGATTVDEYRQHIEKDSALERRFQSIIVNEPTLKQTLDILKGIKPDYESFHRVKYTNQCINTILDCADRFIPDRYFPDKAIDILDEVGARARFRSFTKPAFEARFEESIRQATKNKEDAVKKNDYNAAVSYRAQEQELLAQYEEEYYKWIDSQDKTITINQEEVRDYIYDIIGISTDLLDESESKRLKLLPGRLKKVVIGQDKAIMSLSKCIARARIGLNDPMKPNGSFLFLGTTGVGKTFVAKNVAKQLYGSEKSLIQVDMSEMMEQHSVSKIIGSPPGYVGHGETKGILDKIRRNPHCVVLFDEIEKAHPDVLQVLLQVFEEGHLTDSTGRSISFKNTIIILTSNIGAANINNRKEHMGFGTVELSQDVINDMVMKELKGILKPEFINRLDEVIVFETLKEKELLKILKNELDKVISRAKKSLKVKSITYDKSILQCLLDKNMEKEYGARPLKRIIKASIEDNIASFYIDNISRIDKKTEIVISSNDTCDIEVGIKPILLPA